MTTGPSGLSDRMRGIGECNSHSSDSAPPTAAVSRVALSPINVAIRPPTREPTGRMP